MQVQGKKTVSGLTCDALLMHTLLLTFAGSVFDVCVMVFFKQTLANLVGIDNLDV